MSAMARFVMSRAGPEAESTCKDETSHMDSPGDEAASPVETSNQEQPYLRNTPSEAESSSNDSLDTESPLLQQQQAPDDINATTAAKDIELQHLSRELEKAKFKLDWTERKRQSIETKLATSNAECHDLRNRLKDSDETIDSFNTVAALLNVKAEKVVETVVQLKVEHRNVSSFVRWLSSLSSSDCERRAIAAEARLAMYAEVDYPAQVRAAKEETRSANRRIEALASRLSAKGTALEITQIDSNKVQELKKTVSANKDKIKDLEHRLKAESLSVSQLKEEKKKLLDQLESARKKTEATEQTILDRLELARVKSESTQQTLLDRLDTVLLQTHVQLSTSEGTLQTLVDYQKKALTNVQKELATSKNDHSVVQKELEEAKKKIKTLKIEHDAFSYDLSRAVGLGCYGTAAIRSRVAELREESAATNLALMDVDGDTKIAKIEVLKTAREDLETANKELEDLRKDRDGIYKTLDVSSCLGAHLIIGNLKLARLNLEVLRKVIGTFEDEEAACEVKRLQQREVELVKLQSAVGAIPSESNKAKVDALKDTWKKE